MSFILDALRKSEHARQRETGPGLAEIPVAPSRPKKNLWATAAVALLLVNLLAVGVLLLRRAQQDEAPVAAANTAPASAGPATAPVAQPPTARPVPGPVTQGAAPPRAAPAEPRPREPQSTGRRGRRSRQCRALAAGRRRSRAGRPAGRDTTGQHAAGFRRLRAGRPKRRTRPTCAGRAVQPAAAPTAAARHAGRRRSVARGGVPPLHLDLHVYASQPQQRFVFVNSRKYREGDTLTEGPVVEEITPDGAILNFRGSRFRLSND